jgi:hypothetical protein
MADEPEFERFHIASKPRSISLTASRAVAAGFIGPGRIEWRVESAG